MPSSISSSDPNQNSSAAKAERPAPGLRLTASDRPGVAQPVPERDIPDRPWPMTAAAAFACLAVCIGLWEIAMRDYGLRPGDIDDGKASWAEQRRRIDHEPVKVAIVGDSRLLFDVNLDRFEALTGIRPVQLALPGTSGRPFLEDLSKDENFRGLLLVGMAEPGYFGKRGGLMIDALGYDRKQSPGDRVSFELRKKLEQVFAFIDDRNRLSILVAHMDRNRRKVQEGPYENVWKLSESFEGRDTAMWAPIENEEFRRTQARNAWSGFEGRPVSDEAIEMTKRISRESVERIRSRGGDVIFVRPPSAAEGRVNEEKRLPKEKGWDALLAATDAHGFHTDDTPATQGLVIPEHSHLSAACAVVYTDILVRFISPLTNLLPAKLNDLPPLKAEDCSGPNPTVKGSHPL